MKKQYLFLINLIIAVGFLAIISGCSGKRGNGYVVGVRQNSNWYQPDPYGMVFIRMGSYNMGPSDQDVPYSQTAQSKTVSVQPFYMDETEITNNEYRQFVCWVRDSIARYQLGVKAGVAAFAPIPNVPIAHPKADPNYKMPDMLNWSEEVDYYSKDQQVIDALEPLYLPEQERFYRRKEIDSRLLYYDYYWIDMQSAARREYRNDSVEYNKFHNAIAAGNTPPYTDFKPYPNAGNIQFNTQQTNNNPFYDRRAFIRKYVTNIYPDTLAWIHDFTYSFNEPMTMHYFWHPAYDNYPVVGVNWLQARAFCIWRTQLLNDYLHNNDEAYYNDFRLPTESEWEWAARGGAELNPYPWGGPYTRLKNGCFLANFKPLRGNYVDDGGFSTVVVGTYNANDFGLYDMAGNVAEWTNNAFDESAYNFSHDFNPDFVYEADFDEPPTRKRKVIRGGSWKDVGYFLQCGTRTYEYQDTAKCYIGFRCVQSYLGREKDDAQRSNVVP